MYKKAVGVVLAVAGILSVFPQLHTGFTVRAQENFGAPAAVSLPPYLDFLKTAERERPSGAAVLHSGEALLSEGEALTLEGEVPASGLYDMEITYRSLDDSGKNPVIAFSVNGQTPYQELSSVQLLKKWKDAERGRLNAKGDEVIPRQEEIKENQTCLISNHFGFYGERLSFPLERGKNTLTLTVRSGTLSIGTVTMKNEEAPSYGQAAASFQYEEYSGEPLYIEAENTLYKSDTTVFPAADSTSPAITPYDLYSKKLNTIGGNPWSSPGQYLEWELEIPQNGLYQITLKARQNLKIGLTSYRRLTIDGKTPYKELEQIAFPYGVKYEHFTPGGESPFLFALSKGRHILRLEVSGGKYADILTDANTALVELNNVYRKIIMLTGSSPDRYRDYEIPENLPDVVRAMEEQKNALNAIDEYLNEEMGSASSATKVIGTLARQLGEFLADPYQITARLAQFKSNITALSTWLMGAKSQPLTLDYIVLSAPGARLKNPNAGFFQQIKHEFLSFIHTFSDDYRRPQNGREDQKTITAWISEGQVAMNAVSELIENDFAEKSDFNVDLKLVTTPLLTAVASGKGPDVALQIASNDAMNYAFRDALTELSGFGDLPEIAKRFRSSAMTPVTYKGRVYGLPVSQTYHMMYYRSDILEELGVKIPETWEDVVTVMAALKKNNLQFGLPSDLLSYYMLLFQQGGELYNQDLTATALREYNAISAFNIWCGYYTDYKLPISYDAVNRLRTGEMPILLAPYNTYNQLVITAPEIMGLWGMTLVPGTRKGDGSLDRGVAGSVTCAVILKNPNEAQCYEFLKWWTSDRVQLEYSNRKEMILGLSGRTETANVYAFEHLAWETADLQKLQRQAEHVKGVPSVPGSYYASRHLENALNRVLYSSGTPGDELRDFSFIIDREIARKRQELRVDE